MGIEASYNFRSVSATVTTSGVVGADGLAALNDSGYGLLVNLLPDDSEYAVADEAAIVEAQGVTYAYIPVDFAAPKHEELDAFAAVMDANADKLTHVHCAANYRVSVFYGLYAVRKGWWTADEADAHIDSIWAPDTDPAWREFIASERARDSR